MPELFGHTRARVAARHALITRHNAVNSVIPGITGADVAVQISGAMGARFSQILVTFKAGGAAALPAGDLQTFGYVLSGGLTLGLAGRKARLSTGGYFLAPAGHAWTAGTVRAGTRLVLFRKAYEALAGVEPPEPVIGSEQQVAGVPFLGDEAARLQVLLPDNPAFDMAVNVFAYQPGGHLPFVEIHVMEHGLVMLDGQGVYRLEDSWYPVEAGDVIWMAPYCPQWFVAMGKTPARYLYYKDVNRPVR